jgi:hypothetical protein
LGTTTTQNLVVRNLGSGTMTGTITVPAFVSLFFNGTAVSDTYNYTIPGAGNGIFTISVYFASETMLDNVINLTSNDPTHSTQVVALHVETVGNEDEHTVAVTRLEGNYPNPFSPNTTIRYSVKEQGNLQIHIYNTKGQLVKTLVNNNTKAGNFTAVWNGTDDNGIRVSSGIYFYRMQTAGVTQTRKMMLMK